MGIAFAMPVLLIAMSDFFLSKMFAASETAIPAENHADIVWVRMALATLLRADFPASLALR